MRRILSGLVAVGFVAAGTPALAEEEHHTGERAGEAVDRAGEKVEKAGHKAKKKVKKAARKAKERMRTDDRAEDRAERSK
jgi:hypothetical protein